MKFLVKQKLQYNRRICEVQLFYFVACIAELTYRDHNLSGLYHGSHPYCLVLLSHSFKSVLPLETLLGILTTGKLFFTFLSITVWMCLLFNFPWNWFFQVSTGSYFIVLFYIFIGNERWHISSTKPIKYFVNFYDLSYFCSSLVTCLR